MTTATVRDLRTNFPKLKRLLEDEEEVVITDHGTPVAVLKRVEPPVKRARPIDYYTRLKRRMPKAISVRQRQTLDDDREER